MVKPRWRLRASNTQYDIWDCDLGGSVISLTLLKPHQHTNGHAHPHSERYLALYGKAELVINGAYRLPFKALVGMPFKVNEGNHHQVFNLDGSEAAFLCMWNKEEAKGRV